MLIAAGLVAIATAAALHIEALRSRASRQRAVAALVERMRIDTVRAENVALQSLIEDGPDFTLQTETAELRRRIGGESRRLVGSGENPEAAARAHREEIVGRNLAELVPESDHARMRAALARIATPGARPRITEWDVEHRDGRVVHLEAVGNNMLHDDIVGGLVLTLRDVSERRAMEERLRHQAFHDGLTGLANRSLFEDRVGHALARSRRSGAGVAVLFVDIDDFKTVNDSLGHAVGDQLLSEVARRVASALRSGDTAARLGGDEFAVLLEAAGVTTASEVAERILASLAEPIAIEGRALGVGASIGVACAAPAECDAAALLRAGRQRRGQAPGRAARARRAGGGRRLRHRLLVAQLPAAAGDRLREDRPLVRRRRLLARPGRGARALDRRARARARPSGDRRGDRGRGRGGRAARERLPARSGLPVRRSAVCGGDHAPTRRGAASHHDGVTPEFFTADPASHAALRESVAAVLEALTGTAALPGPRSPLDRDAIEALDPCPPEGASMADVLDALCPVLEGGIRVSDPGYVAHLHPPPLIAAAAGELAVAVTNQSQDAFDASPAGTYAEDRLVRWLAQLHGLGPAGSGVMTMGGTGSNLLGLALARDSAGERVRRDGLPADHRTWRFIASDSSHDSVRRSAALLGLGLEAVAEVHTDARGAMDPGALDATLAGLRDEGLRPIAFVATAGTTDLGAIDPIDVLADRAREHGAWLHVDAAVGSGLMLSETLRERLRGIERADSVTCDLHKLWWQPFPASALLVPDVSALRAVHYASVYLNRPEDEAEGQLNLVGRSLDTSRRFDALKVLIALRATGRRRMAELVERCVVLAEHGAAAVRARPALELVTEPSTVMVCFRVRGDDALNTRVQRALFASGEAVLGRTRVKDAVVLKLTLVNPLITPEGIDALLDRVVSEAGRES